MRPGLTASTVGAMVLSFGCQDGFSGFADDVLVESDHYRYHSSRSTLPLPCAETVDDLEAHFAAIRGLLGFSWPEGRRVDYWRFRDVFDLQDAGVCSSGLPACARDGAVYSSEILHEHELIHAYLLPSGRPPGFLSEGLAVVLTCDHGPLGSPGEATRAQLSAIDWRQLATWFPGNNWSASGDLYRLSGELARHLLDRFGPSVVMSYYAASSRSVDAGPVGDLFQHSFGVTLAQALVDALATERADGPCLRPYACASPLATMDGTDEPIAISCAHGRMYRRFDLQAQTVLAAVTTGPGPDLPEAFIRSCRAEGSPRDGRDGTLAGLGSRPTDLSVIGPGSYVVGFSPPPSLFSYALEPTVDRYLSRQCAAIEASGYPLEGGAVQLNLPQDGGTFFFSLSVAPAREVTVFGGVSGDIRLCRSCADDPPGCPPLPTVETILSLDGRYVLVLRTAQGAGFGSLALRPSLF